MKENVWNADLGNGYYKNPILYTDYSDPDVIRVGEDYFMVASSFCNTPALPVLHSKDLVNWKVINYVLDSVPEERYEKPMHGCGVWAPSIRYHEGIYYVCVGMPDEGIYMSTTTDPFGSWSEAINIRPGAGWIDPCPFWDEDGNAYLVAGVAKSRIGYKSILNMVRMTPDGTSVFGEEVKIFDGNLNGQETIEGPKMYKKNGYYYIFAPAGGVKPGWQTVLRSRDVWGPYEYKIVLRQGDTEINGPHQGGWIDTVTGEDWFIHFQDVFAAGRITHLQPMTWKDDWPIIGVAQEGKEYGEPVLEYKKPNVGATYEITSPSTSDDFSGEKLGLQWQWNANYNKDWYKIDTTKQVLQLHSVSHPNEIPLSEIPNLLIQKWPAPTFTATTKMNLSHLITKDRAGYMSMGIRFGGLLVEKHESGYELLSILGEQEFDQQVVTASQEVNKIAKFTQEEIYFRYEVISVGYRTNTEEKIENAPQEKIIFSYSLDGSEYKEALSFLAEAGRWVGVKSGVVCYREDNKVGGYAEVEYVKYASGN